MAMHPFKSQNFSKIYTCKDQLPTWSGVPMASETCAQKYACMSLFVHDQEMNSHSCFNIMPLNVWHGTCISVQKFWDMQVEWLKRDKKDICASVTDIGENNNLCFKSPNVMLLWPKRKKKIVWELRKNREQKHSRHIIVHHQRYLWSTPQEFMIIPDH